MTAISDTQRIAFLAALLIEDLTTFLEKH